MEEVRRSSGVHRGRRRQRVAGGAAASGDGVGCGGEGGGGGGAAPAGEEGERGSRLHPGGATEDEVEALPRCLDVLRVWCSVAVP